MAIQWREAADSPPCSQRVFEEGGGEAGSSRGDAMDAGVMRMSTIENENVCVTESNKINYNLFLDSR
jgi:hypothetical protein